ncbi:hypothetical protein MED01_002495 [Micromonospora sp. MED01]|uniref:hypothetical protein n=1 Tax=Micromonospora alfalfae TaxID=2911212 RepID=UPI001EE7AE66|nr:hypothetical protein [Micromonospora alfalfae]MCG5464329.1 hypothetical protein [Micromonospora alfalfae]
MATRPQQSSRRRTHRLLLLAGLTIGGAGAALALTGSPAHANDRPRPIADTLHGVTQPLGRVLNGQPSNGEKPRPVRDLTAKVRDHTTPAVTRATTKVDRVTRPLPVVGRTVDKATDVLVGVVTAAKPPAPTGDTPTSADTPTTPPSADTAAPQRATGAPTAPEPAPPGPPTLGGASSGATNLVVQHPDVRHTATGHGETRAAHHDTTPTRPQRTPRRTPQAIPGTDHAHPHDASLRTVEHPAGDARADGQPRWQQPHTGHHSAHHDGLTQPPSPPPG